MVVTVHDLFALTHPHLCSLKNRMHFGLLLPRAVRRARAVHCVSQWTRERLVERFPEAQSRAHVITPGVDDIFFDPPAEEPTRTRARHGVGPAPFLAVGGAEPKKNLPRLVQAYAALRQDARTARDLLIVGPPGPNHGQLRRAVRALGLERDVVFAGYVPRADMPALYRAALALVFPSLAEGFGLPPLEAMACGTPVIAGRGTGLDESVGEAALRVDPHRVEDITEAMARVEADAGLRADLGARGRARAEGFRWSDRAGQFWDLYAEALSGG
jgi:glycosyltransferase involved in cell wall biosynthesis